MKIAFHFNADHESLETLYGYHIQKYFFLKILDNRTINVSTKIFVGDLLLRSLAMDQTETENVRKLIFNPKKYKIIFKKWISPENVLWSRFEPQKKEIAFTSRIFVICLESIDMKIAEYLHLELEKFPSYLGALEVDDTSFIHWEVYSNYLFHAYRMIHRNLNIFWDGFNEAEKDEGLKKGLEGLGFNKISFESL